MGDPLGMSCRHGVGEFGAGLAQARGQVIIAGVVNPTIKAGSKDRDSNVREQCGACRLAASANQLGRECVGNRGELRSPPFLQLRATGDDLATLRGV